MAFFLFAFLRMIITTPKTKLKGGASKRSPSCHCLQGLEHTNDDLQSKTWNSFFFFGDAMSLVLRSQLSLFEPGPFTPRDGIPMG
jgi:hypothetical protein